MGKQLLGAGNVAHLGLVLPLKSAPQKQFVLCPVWRAGLFFIAHGITAACETAQCGTGSSSHAEARSSLRADVL